MTDIVRSTMQQDRPIKLYIAQEPAPYITTASTLCSISDYFIRSLKHQSSLGGETDVMRFPEDDQTAWETLLYWKLRSKMPEIQGNNDDRIIQVIRCWILGDKYDVKEFQYLSMLKLSKILQEAHVKLDAVKLAFDNTTDGSPLRKFLARQTLKTFCDTDEQTGPTSEDFEMFDGVSGFITEIVRAHRFWQSRDYADAVL